MKLSFEPAFVRRLLATAIPVCLQTLMFSSRSLADIMMTSHLGVSEVAAVGFSGRIIFVMNLALFGIASGGGVIVSQHWGAKSREGARRSTAISLLLGLPFALLFIALCFGLPEAMVGLASKDAEVIALGGSYLRIAGLMSLPLILGTVFSVALRSIGQAKISMRLSVIGVGSNVLLNYLLIFGHGGFPALGLDGAAYATLISSLLEAACLIAFVYLRKNPLACRWSDLKLGLQSGLWRKVARVSLPLAVNGVVWSMGVLIYNILVGRMGTSQLAVLSMITPIESIIVALYVGIATAASVITGHRLGAEDYSAAWSEGKAFLVWSMMCAVFSCALIWSSRGLILSFYPAIEEETLSEALQVLSALAFVSGFRSINVTVIVGLLRSGGDARFCLGLDIFCQWAVGIVLTYLAAFVWKLPLYMVFLAINSEEFVKVFLCVWRFGSKKWIRNLIKGDDEAVASCPAVS
ncbi:MATE family efflux transporter [Pelagicoccus sp. SDUM812003]|uniref:MATE family efflux transporter n=1 Tax=Pelagicoccus sp. SDUM812003 TaxID=3041267 RepID=UPI00280CB873|nr:MATE family efflux transporter [Pelagicoccus sp. SDUM812003]MDQ8204090.1 MATE family efflux transporter [Pelagicoccus sp. SDUM812003]